MDDPTLTLRQGLDRCAGANQDVLSARDLSEEAAQFFRCHDVAHVVFASTAGGTSHATSPDC